MLNYKNQRNQKSKSPTTITTKLIIQNNVYLYTYTNSFIEINSFIYENYAENAMKPLCEVRLAYKLLLKQLICNETPKIKLNKRTRLINFYYSDKNIVY